MELINCLSSNKLGLLVFIRVFMTIAVCRLAGSTLAEPVPEGMPVVRSTTPVPPPPGGGAGGTFAVTEAVTKTKQQDSFYFDPPPVSQDAVEGEELRLRCDVSNRRQIMFYWTLNGKQLTNTSRRFQEGSDLRIARVDRVQDSGSLRCVATNVSTGIALRSTEAKLNILWINGSTEVQLKQPARAEEIVEGSEVILKCEVDGNPEPTVEWFRNKYKLAQSDRIRATKKKLTLTAVTAADNGVYTCRARNTVRIAENSESFLLNVAGSDSARLNLDTFTRVRLVKRKGAAMFNCEYSNAQLTEWYFDQKRITNDTGQQQNKYMLMSNGSLFVRNVDDRDAGVYRCVGISSKDKGVVQTFSAELLIAYLDDMTETSFDPKPSNPLVVPVNGKLELRCQPPKGLPAPVQRWDSPYNTEITDQGRIKAIDGVLSITSAEELDSGNYTCRMENLAAIRTRTVPIVVSITPKISRPPLSIRVTEGEAAIFDCRVISTPHPVTVISWTKEEENIDPMDPRYTVDAAAGTLRINHVQLMDDGNYACVVNTTGHPIIVSTNGHLYVEKQLKFSPLPINAKLELSSNSTVRCKADGKTPPTIRWSRAGAVAQLPVSVRDVDGVMYFTGVQHSDAGDYTCTASSDQGTINVTIKVDVIVKPRFKVRPSNTTGFEGYPTMIHCVAVGEPTPAVQWDKNNKVNSFDQRRFKVLPNGSLHVSEVYMEDIGKYGCTVGNSGGFEREEVYLHVSNGDPRLHGSHIADGPATDESFNMVKTIIIAVCSAVAYLAIVIGLTVYCSIRLMRAKNLRKQQNSESDDKNGAENGGVPNETTELMEKKGREFLSLKGGDVEIRSMSGVGSHNSHSTQSGSSRSGTFHKIYESLQFPRNELQTVGMLGKGHYGDVFLAKAHGICSTQSEMLVIVKSLLSHVELHQAEFCREVDMLSKLNHEHVVRLIGVCREMEPLFLITEYCEWGDLKQFLLAVRKDAINLNGSTTNRPNVHLPPLTTSQKISMCSQVALGMEHLTNNRFVHRDLATRNVLLASNLDVKVACLSICRDVYATEYHLVHGHTLIPLRWMAPEASLAGEYSAKSDVWSFGVFAWEVFSYADMPYRTKTNEDVVRDLRQGDCGRLELPAGSVGDGGGCPADMWTMIQRCLSHSPRDRPSFSDIVLTVGEMTTDSDL